MILHGTKFLETERLILRPLVIGDEIQMFQNYCNDERVTQFLTWKPHGKVENTLIYLNSCLDKKEQNPTHTFHWAIVSKENNQIIGTIEGAGLKEERHAISLGYVLSYDYWGKNIMPEAVQKILEYLFVEEGFERIYAVHDLNNPKSGRVMQKVGMQKEGVLRKYEKNKDGGLIDVVIYAITNDDYFNKINKKPE